MPWEEQLATLEARVRGLEAQAAQANATGARIATSLEHIERQAPAFAQGARQLPGSLDTASSRWLDGIKIVAGTLVVAGGGYAGYRYATRGRP
jgi:hypothetical protein